MIRTLLDRLFRRSHARATSSSKQKPEPTTRHGLVGRDDLATMKRAFQIGFLRRRGLEPHHRLLDVGCGTLRGGIPIIEHLDAEHYVGIEARPQVVEEARAELREHGLETKSPRLVCADDPRTVNLDERFDFAWSFSVLFHMSDDTLDKALEMVARHLADDGVFYANIHDTDGKPDGEWQGFPVVYRTLARYEEMLGRHGLVAKNLGPLSDWDHVTGIASQDEQLMLEIRRRSA